MHVPNTNGRTVDHCVDLDPQKRFPDLIDLLNYETLQWYGSACSILQQRESDWI